MPEGILMAASNLKDNIKVIIFDIDGVLADVSSSYREAIKKTAGKYIGRIVPDFEIQSLKDEGGFNNDWKLTFELIKRNLKLNSKITYEEVKCEFQKRYLGKSNSGLISKEKLILNIDVIEELSKKYSLGIITGRPREEAEFFLKKNGIYDLFKTIICKEDVGPNEKPDPLGIILALKELAEIPSSAIYLGDTVDDITASTSAGVIGLGVIPPYVKDKEKLENLLFSKGAKFVLRDINKLIVVLNELEC
jgi:HAD superfamily hydrolase (TIGR01548 family)